MKTKFSANFSPAVRKLLNKIESSSTVEQLQKNIEGLSIKDQPATKKGNTKSMIGSKEEVLDPNNNAMEITHQPKVDTELKIESQDVDPNNNSHEIKQTEEIKECKQEVVDPNNTVKQTEVEIKEEKRNQGTTINSQVQKPMPRKKNKKTRGGKKYNNAYLPGVTCNHAGLSEFTVKQIRRKGFITISSNNKEAFYLWRTLVSPSIHVKPGMRLWYNTDKDTFYL